VLILAGVLVMTAAFSTVSAAADVHCPPHLVDVDVNGDLLVAARCELDGTRARRRGRARRAKERQLELKPLDLAQNAVGVDLHGTLIRRQRIQSVSQVVAAGRIAWTVVLDVLIERRLSIKRLAPALLSIEHQHFIEDFVDLADHTRSVHF
jgi:hypothetical protein